MRSELIDQASEYGKQAADYGKTASHAIEETAQRIPTEAYLIGGLASIGISLTLKLLGRDRDAEFVGHWAPTFLTLGLLTKLFEHDRKTNSPTASPRGKGRGRGE